MGALALALALRWGLPAVSPGQGGPLVASIAVLPFTNLSGDPSRECFVAGMTDELTTALFKLGALVVISQSVTGRFANQGMSLPEIASELGVDAVLDGSVLRRGERAAPRSPVEGSFSRPGIRGPTGVDRVGVGRRRS